MRGCLDFLMIDPPNPSFPGNVVGDGKTRPKGFFCGAKDYRVVLITTIGRDEDAPPRSKKKKPPERRKNER